MDFSNPNFFALEVNAVEEFWDPGDHKFCCEVVDPDCPAASFWSVYLLEQPHIAHCIADCPDEPTAFAIARALQLAHPNLKRIISRRGS
jgi:hypothetical protein